MQTKVYFTPTIKNCTCAHIGTPRYWLLLVDLKWENWTSGYCYHKCVKNVRRRVGVASKRKNKLGFKLKSEKHEVMERYVICFLERVIPCQIITGL